MNHPTREEIKAAEENQRRAVEKMYREIDLDSMTDKALAQWQSKQRPGSREAILGDQQWKIRLLNQQLRTARWLGAIGCVSGLAGVVLGYYLRTLDALPASNVSKERADTHAEQKSP